MGKQAGKQISLIEGLSAGTVFEFAKPWRLTDKNVCAVVPVLRRGSAGLRGYMLLEEVREKAKITDTGRIDSVKVDGFGKPVLVRSGTIFEGMGSQNRGAISSKIILPDAVAEIPVRCVYASHPISPGAKMEVAETYAPSRVHEALLKASLGRAGQSEVWSSVREQSFAAMAMTPRRYAAESPSPMAETDNLLGISRNLAEFNKSVADVISKMPADLNGQVGVAIVDIDGVLGIEVFDHPDSWLAASKAVARKYGDVLAKEGKAASALFKLDEDAVREEIAGFIRGLGGRKEKITSENTRAKTYAFETDAAVGERVVLDGTEIHVVVARRTSEAERAQAYAGPSGAGRGHPGPTPWPRSDESSWPMGCFGFGPPQGEILSEPSYALDLLESLRKRPQRWTDLEPQFASKGRSTKTLSTALKESAAQGLVEKVTRPTNGHKLYGLTPTGEKTLLRMKRVANAPESSA